MSYSAEARYAHQVWELEIPHGLDRFRDERGIADLRGRRGSAGGRRTKGRGRAMTVISHEGVAVKRDPREALLPGGLGRGTLFLSAPPPRVVAGCGYTVTDEAGRELIDFHNNFTVLVHGHAQADVTEAAVQAARHGACFGLPTVAELELADELVGRVPWAEQVRFINSGSEAMMSAVRMARAATGRDVIIMLSPAYHGTADSVLRAPSATRGIPAGTLADAVTVAPNDHDALREALEAHRDNVAALILDLAPALGGCVALEDDYVHASAARAREHGALVIVDEVISFRHHYEGLAHGRYGLEPDMLVLGKIIGGGFPVGAVLGREETMRVLDPSRPDGLLHGGTFSANPVTMRAGTVAMQLFDRPAVERLRRLGEHARGRLGEVAAAYGWQVSGVGSVLRLAPAQRDTDRRRHELWWKAYANGLLLTSSGVICLSAPMDEAVIDEAAARLKTSFEDLENNAVNPQVDAPT